MLTDDDRFDDAKDDAKSADNDEQNSADVRLALTVRVNHRSRDVRPTGVGRLNLARAGYHRLMLHSACSIHSYTRNSSGDEIANVNILYDDFVYVL